jgi:hypothetical protein
MPAFEFLWLVKESAYGTPTASPVAGTDSIYIRLPDSNAFGVQADPQFAEIPYGGGEDMLVEAPADVTQVRGTLATNLYPTQAAFLLNWAGTRVNAGQTAPWTTTEPPGDLASVSAYHGYARNDGTIKRTRYAGGKVGQWRLAASRTDPVWKISLDLIFQKPVGNSYDASADPTATEFPAPADADLPTGPYLFSHAAGGLLLGTGAGTSRTQFESLEFTCANTIDARPFESRWLQVAAFRGRRPQLNAGLRLKVTPDDRSAYEAATAQRAQLTLTKGANSVVLDLKASNVIRQLRRDLPLNKVFMHNLQLGSLRDATAGTDLTITVT